MQSRCNNQKGQVTILIVFLIPVICLLGGIAIDLGWVTYQKSKIQDASDLSALSGAQYLPMDTVKAEDVALDIFANNYDSPSSTIENINFFQSNRGIKVHYKDNIPLFFMTIIGLEKVTIEGKAAAEISPLSKPVEIIPIAIFHNTPLNFGEESIIYGDNQYIGNFGLIDISNGTADLDNTLLSNWISNGYTSANGPMPITGMSIPTITGERVGPVYRGIDKRIKNGRTLVILPVVDFSKCTGGCQAPILGFAKFEIMTVEIKKDKGEYVEIKGRYIKSIDSKAITNPDADYYGIKNIYLVK